MKPLKEHLTNAIIKGDQVSTTIQQTGRTDLTDDGAKFINKVFKRLIVLCPAWKAAIDGDLNDWASLYKTELVEAIKAAGVTKGKQIENGLSMVRIGGSPFLPSPGAFAKLCKASGSDSQHLSSAYSCNGIKSTKKLLASPRAPADKAMLGIRKLRESLE